MGSVWEANTLLRSTLWGGDVIFWPVQPEYEMDLHVCVCTVWDGKQYVCIAWAASVYVSPVWDGNVYMCTDSVITATTLMKTSPWRHSVLASGISLAFIPSGSVYCFGPRPIVGDTHQCDACIEVCLVDCTEGWHTENVSVSWNHLCTFCSNLQRSGLVLIVCWHADFWAYSCLLSYNQLGLPS